jgi:protein phosphatase
LPPGKKGGERYHPRRRRFAVASSAPQARKVLSLREDIRAPMRTTNHPSAGQAGSHVPCPLAKTALPAGKAASTWVAQTCSERLDRVRTYREAYRRYCWPATSLADYRLAPFHLLASEGAVHTDKTNRWHLETLHRLAACDPAFMLATPFLEIDVTDDSAVKQASEWWEALTGTGGEGIVLKPLDFIARGPKGLLQPAMKCRGREYLRINYGPEYTADDQLPRLRSRGLSGKRSLAAREFALGIEALERFVAREPLRRVHECVFGVLAMESEPVDPRL